MKQDQSKSADTVEVIAKTLTQLSRSVADLLKGPLNRKALLVLLANSSGMSQGQIDRVLHSITDLDKDWLNKR